MQLDQAILFQRGVANAQLLSNASTTSGGKLEAIFNQLFPEQPLTDTAQQSKDAIFAQLTEAAAAGKSEIFTELIQAEATAAANNEPTLLMAAVMANQLSVAQALITAGADVNARIEAFFEFNALHFAVKNENVAMVELLLTSGADPNWSNANPGAAPIVEAIKQGNVDLVKLLLAHGAKATFDTGFKALVEAAQQDNPEIISLLLEAGCDVDDADFNGSALKAACTRCNVSVIQQLLAAGAEKSGADFLAIFGAPFMAKQLSGWLGEQPDPTEHIPAAIQAFIDAGVDVNAQRQDGTTALILAICENYTDVVNQLLTAGADPNLLGQPWSMFLFDSSDSQDVAKQYAYSIRPLNLAAAFGHVEMVRSLLAHGADPSLTDTKGTRAINIAIQEGHQDIVELLKAAGAEVETDGETTEWIEATLMGAAKQGNVDTLRSALEKGADPNASELSADRRKRLKTALMFAAERGHFAAVKLLVEKGAEVNLSDRPNKKLGKTPLMCAAYKNHADVARFLLEAGAVVDAQDKRGQTALFYAVQEEAEEAVEVLLTFGADVQKKSWDGTPFKIATYSSPKITKLVTQADQAKSSPKSSSARVEMLSAAAFDGNAELVRDLIQQGIDVNAVEKEGEWTALMSSAAAGHETVVQLLIAAGAAVNKAAASGQTALSEAGYWGHLNIVKLLMSAGADINVADIESGWTPLMKTVVFGQVKVLKVLLEAGADATIKDNEGRTVLAIAREENKPAIAQILRDAGITE